MSKRADKKRVIYFALVVFKSAESLTKLSDSKFLQKKVNTLAKKQVGYTANPFLAGEDKLVPGAAPGDSEDEDEDLTPEEREQKRKEREHRKKMEAMGFTTVTMDDTVKKRKRGVDEFGTVVEGITEEEAQRIVEKQRMR